eukprot:9494862-Pyramimonas_sp.AAC.1
MAGFPGVVFWHDRGLSGRNSCVDSQCRRPMNGVLARSGISQDATVTLIRGVEAPGMVVSRLRSSKRLTPNGALPTM